MQIFDWFKMSSIVSYQRNIKKKRDRRHPSVSRINRIAVFVSIAFYFCPDFAEFFVRVNDEKIRQKILLPVLCVLRPNYFEFPKAVILPAS